MPSGTSQLGSGGNPRLPNDRLICLYGETNGILVLESGNIEATENVPPPAPRGELLLADQTRSFKWLTAEGRVRALRKSEVGWHLDLIRDGRFYTAVVPRRGRLVTDAYLNAWVRVEGISTPLNLIGEPQSRLGIWVDDWNRIERIRRPARKTNETSITAIRELTAAAGAAVEIASQPVRIRGELVRALGPAVYQVRDAGGEIEIRPRKTEMLFPGDQLDLQGFLLRTTNGIVLADAAVRAFGSLGYGAAEAAPAWENLREFIDDLAVVRDMDKDTVGTGLPVRVTGIVTLVESNAAAIYLSHPTGAIRVENSAGAPFAPGDRVVVAGNVAAGTFGPVIRSRALVRLDHAGLPEPFQVTGTGLYTGRHEGEFVAFDGVVRRRGTADGYRWLEVVRADRRYHVRLPGNVELARPLIGARIQVAAVVQARVNAAGQQTGVNLLLPAGGQLLITTPAPDQPFTMRLTDIGNLMKFRSDSTYTRQKRVSGTVLLARTAVSQ